MPEESRQGHPGGLRPPCRVDIPRGSTCTLPRHTVQRSGSTSPPSRRRGLTGRCQAVVEPARRTGRFHRHSGDQKRRLRSPGVGTGIGGLPPDTSPVEQLGKPSADVAQTQPCSSFQFRPCPHRTFHSWLVHRIHHGGVELASHGHQDRRAVPGAAGRNRLMLRPRC
jgi:hypothetical protein